MKKFFTLIFSLGVFATSFAQTASHQTDKKDQYVINSEYKKIDIHHDDIYTFSVKEKDSQIAKINSDYNLKVASVKSNNRISKRDRRMQIRKAQSIRTKQIVDVNSKFNSVYNIQANQYDGHKQ